MKQGQDTYGFRFAREGITSDTKYNIVEIIDAAGKKMSIDMWRYALYFFENIQHNHISEDLLYIDGIPIDTFIKHFACKKNIESLQSFLRVHAIHELQEEMLSRYNTHINLIALYGLGAYVKEIINRRLLLKLKPTIQDTLEEIGDIENISAITFKLNNERTHRSDNVDLKQVIVDALHKRTSICYEADSIVRCIDAYTGEYGQIEFVRYISQFFHDYFHIKRRANGYITSTEQRIICQMLNFYGLTTFPVTASRFRQLFNSKYNIRGQFMQLNNKWLPQLSHANAIIYLGILPYKDWKNGKINPLNHNPDLRQGEITIRMPESYDKILAIASAICEVINDTFASE